MLILNQAEIEGDNCLIFTINPNRKNIVITSLIGDSSMSLGASADRIPWVAKA